MRLPPRRARFVLAALGIVVRARLADGAVLSPESPFEAVLNVVRADG